MKLLQMQKVNSSIAEKTVSKIVNVL